MAGQPTQSVKIYLHIMLIAMLSQVCVNIETAELAHFLYLYNNTVLRCSYTHILVGIL